MLPGRRKLYSTADVARLLRVDASTVKRWADSGKLVCFRTIGGHRRFNLNQIREFIANYHLEGIASSDPLMGIEDRFY
ncbi:MAG: putative cobalamin binding protein [Bacteroidetes bacterium]|nr:putative cobalamin binding protein [Bacteroidota bacterium]